MGYVMNRIKQTRQALGEAQGQLATLLNSPAKKTHDPKKSAFYC